MRREEWERHPNFHGFAGMLLGIHDAFRRASATLLRLVEDDSEGVEGRLMATFVPLAQTLHHHHHAEEEMLFPLLAKVLGERPDALFDDHTELMGQVDAVEAHLSTHGREGLAPLLVQLDAILIDHLDREEEVSIPALLKLNPQQAHQLMFGDHF